MSAMNIPRQQSGFAYIAAVVLLIVVAGVCTALLRLSGTQQATVNQGLLGARATLVARAGIEWGFHRLNNNVCNPAPQTLTDFVATSGFTVAVSCTSWSFTEGETRDPTTGNFIEKTIFTINAVACNAATCGSDNPTIITQPDYVERRRVATICRAGTNADC